VKCQTGQIGASCDENIPIGNDWEDRSSPDLTGVIGLDSSTKLLLFASVMVEPDGSLVTIAGTGVARETEDPGPSRLRASAMAYIHHICDGAGG
jgi:hypothetical protein